MSLKSFYERHRENGFAAIAVAARAPLAEDALAQFALAEKIEFPLGVDSKDGPMDVFAEGEMPRVVLMGPQGDVRLRSQQTLASVLPGIQDLLPKLFKERKRYIKEQRKLAQSQAKEKRNLEKTLRKVKAITPEELKAMLDSDQRFGLYFIGAKNAFEGKHIPSAVPVNFAEIDAFFETRDPKEKIVLYCDCENDEWGVSGRAAARLQLDGFKDVAYLKGHLRAWDAEKFRLEEGPR